jgi:hypothetical protein
MLINDFLPHYDFSEHHSISINAPVASVYPIVRALNFSDSSLIRGLFRLRGLPVASLRREGFLRFGFIWLGEVPQQEILLGLVGQFWTLSGHLLRLDSTEFRAFNQAGYVKTVWNFAITKQDQSMSSLTTETRIYCTDPTSRRRFRLYWFVIRPFSAWIRREMLRTVKRKAEQLAQQPNRA